jgi:hypothetical protein
MVMDGTVFGELLNTLKAFGHTLHFPLMGGIFLVALVLRAVIYYTVKRHEWFAREFERRVVHFLETQTDHKTTNWSFYVVSKRLLERTFYEIFEKREKERLSKHDTLVLTSDRLFLIKAGCAWLVHDLLRQIRFLRYDGQPPKLVNITKNNFSKNPAFNRVFGWLPLVATNDLLNILPGLFVVGGIFGTFLSVMGAIPELSGMMSATDPSQSQQIMDVFLSGVATSMGASVIGIFLSVCTSLYNTAFNPERLHVDIVDRFENSLDLLWNYAHSNEVPSGLKPFDENRDPVEALAEAAMNQELDKRKLRSEFDDLKAKSA